MANGWLGDILGLNVRDDTDDDDVELERRATLRVKGDATLEVTDDAVELTIAPGSLASAGHAGTSIVGRAAAGTGAAADIVAGADDRVLARSGGALSFVQVATGMLADLAVTAAKIANLTITGAKIAAATITADKLSGVLEIGYVTDATTSITLASGTHKFKTLLCTSNSAIAITVPAQGTDDFGEGAAIEIIPLGTGQITYAGNGFTILMDASKNKSAGQNTSQFLKKLPGTNQWQLTGSVTA